MAFYKGGREPRADSHGIPGQRSKPAHPRPPSNTGAEAVHFRSLVDAQSRVTVTLKTGERFQGQVRYYDRECFSLRVVNGGPKLFLRKSSVLEIQEDETLKP